MSLSIGRKVLPVYTQPDRQAEPCDWDPVNPGQQCQPGEAMPPSEHVHPGLGPKHPLLIRGQDQGLGTGHVVRLGADVPLAIEEQHPQQLAGGIEQVHRDDADRAGANQGSGGHDWAGERHRR